MQHSAGQYPAGFYRDGKGKYHKETDTADTQLAARFQAAVAALLDLRNAMEHNPQAWRKVNRMGGTLGTLRREIGV